MRPAVLHYLVLLTAFLSGPALALHANRPTPGHTRVAIETSVGAIVVATDDKRAPVTSANFLTYVDDGRFDGVTFYRAARRKSAPQLGLIQGGIDTDARRSLPPIRHEPTTRTGIRHLDATLSMARRSEEHTSELQSLMRISYAVFCLKKKKKKSSTQ